MASPIQYKGGIVCALGVRDLEKSVQWYQEALGFKVTFRLDEYGWAEVQTAWKDVTLGLSQVEKLNVEGGGHPHLRRGRHRRRPQIPGEEERALRRSDPHHRRAGQAGHVLRPRRQSHDVGAKPGLKRTAGAAASRPCFFMALQRKQ